MASIEIIGPDGKRRDAAGGRAPKGTRYVVRWRTPQRQSRKRTFTSKRDAEVFEAKVSTKVAEGSYVDRRTGAITLGEYAGKWIAGRLTKSGQPLRPRTAALYRYLVASYFGGLSSMLVNRITPVDVAAWRAGLRGERTPAKAYRLLRAMMTTAVREQMIAANPCQVDNGGVEPTKERPTMSTAEVWAIADAIAARYRVFVLIGGFVGLRWGELIGLQRRDVDVDRGLLSVERQMATIAGEMVEVPPKSDAGRRTVAVPMMILDELRRHLDTYVGDEPTAGVFRGAKGAVPARSNFQTIWSKARREVGREDLHVHDLRHHAATLAATAGATTKELMNRLGHSSPAASLAYQHATEERDRAVADRMGDLIAGADRPALRVVDDRRFGA